MKKKIFFFWTTVVLTTFSLAGCGHQEGSIDDSLVKFAERAWTIGYVEAELSENSDAIASDDAEDFSSALEAYESTTSWDNFDKLSILAERIYDDILSAKENHD